MHSLTYLLIVAASFLPALVAGDACVIGGPAARVTGARRCCGGVSGKFFQNYPNQGICVLTSAVDNQFEACVGTVDATYDLVCIQCDETTDCGLDS